MGLLFGSHELAAPRSDYVKTAAGRVEFNPDVQARGVVRLVFDPFDRRGTVHGALRHLLVNGVRPPVRSRAGASQGQLQ